jgi:hypothetical protein
MKWWWCQWDEGTGEIGEGSPIWNGRKFCSHSSAIFLASIQSKPQHHLHRKSCVHPRQRIYTILHVLFDM